MPPIALKAGAQTRRERTESRGDVNASMSPTCHRRAKNACRAPFHAASEGRPNASLFSFSNTPRPISDLSTTNRNCCTRPTRDHRRQRSDC